MNTKKLGLIFLPNFRSYQADISRDKLALQVGREMLVLIDEVQQGRIVARGPGDAPEVDGQVIIDGDWEDVGPGDFIEGGLHPDLQGRIGFHHLTGILHGLAGLFQGSVQLGRKRRAQVAHHEPGLFDGRI